MGSGPRVRVWLSSLADNGSLPGVFVTDTASAAHLRRNARTLPPSLLRAPRAVDGQKGYGHLLGSNPNPNPNLG